MGLSHYDIATRWTMRRIPEGGLRGRSLVAYPQTIYSYGMHFPIAQFNDDGTVFFTTDSWGKTTVKHKSIVWNALCPAEDQVILFFLPHKAWADRKAAVASYRERVLDTMAKWQRARVHKNYYITTGVLLLREFQRYCKREKINFDKLLRKDPQLAVAASVIALNPGG